MKSVNIDPIYKIVDEVFANWDLGSHGIDVGVREDIKQAIHEAYLIGAAHGGMDSDVFHEGLEFCQKEG